MRTAPDQFRGSSPPRTWVSEPPPFGTSQDRFAGVERTGGPDYHAAYRDVTQPPRWNAKGWTAMDDYAKGRRGTAPSALGTSSLAPPSAPPRPAPSLAPLAPPVANEVRLQELLGLQRRKLHSEPGPGAYNPKPLPRRRFRRGHDPGVDGPFFLDQMPEGTSTRVKEISALIRAAGDSGLGPGEYDGLMNKDAVLKTAPAVKVGTSDREGRTQHLKSLSVSRSIQNGIDWHVPVVVVNAPPLAPVVNGSAGPTAAGRVGSPPQLGGGGGGGGRGGGSSGSPAAQTHHQHARAAAGGEAAAGGGGGGGGGSRDTSPNGRDVGERYLGAPPAPPEHVLRAVRRQAERRPGDWDWNRLGHNYRTNWTTMHGGAYTHGEHPPPRPPHGSSLSSPVSSQLQQLHAAHLAQQSQQHLPPALLHPGIIYPIEEESSGALLRDGSSTSGPYHHQQHAQHAQHAPQQQQQYQGEGEAADEEERYQQEQEEQERQQQQEQHRDAAVEQYRQQQLAASTAGAADAGSAGGGGVNGGGGGGRGLKGLVREEDLRRRQVAAAMAAQALQVNARVSDWRSKFAG